MRPAFSKVDGLPAATHIGGCGAENGFGSTLRARHREEPAVEARVLARPPHLGELAHHLVEHVAREVGIVDAEAALLGGRRAAAHAELEAPLRQVVEHRDALGDAGRMVDRRRDVEDPRAQVDARGRRREVTEEHLVGREVRVLGEEVVLGRPRVLEAGTVGGLHDRDLVEDPAVLVAVELREHARAVEQSEFHAGERRRWSVRVVGGYPRRSAPQHNLPPP